MAIDVMTPYAFPLQPEQYAPAPLWHVWELVTTKMIRPEALMEQPIPLRNPLLFYLGHIPTFEDIHLTRATKGEPTEPAYYHRIFERGIDPDVDDPSKCHDHSELPDVFPKLEDILHYRERVKKRIASLRKWESVLRSSQNMLPPPDLPRTDFAKLAKEAASRRIQNPWFKIPTQEFTIGFHDPESDEGPDCFFAWDNEREPYKVRVPQLESQGRPVSNGEYAKHLLNDEDFTTFIARHSVKTVWGPIHLAQALDWPVMASFDEVKRYAHWAGARLPTLHELRSIHEYVECGRKAPESQVNHQSHTDPRVIFVDLTETNSGFRNFNPTGITHKNYLCGLGDTRGAAEWTGSLFEPQHGFKPMDIYPGYSGESRT
ncbi:Ergothioneine biosynthesis protein 1 [Fusarium culmorum]|uniref:Ergothioneine biosynthesis protein 1 n=1 Tax=Fusarium culmorum TaxID=5516 RepID=A0A2T4GW50_FUSCU|nr:Ergothioneine biosynthesis protein 1 [Fusarium culmorum]